MPVLLREVAKIDKNCNYLEQNKLYNLDLIVAIFHKPALLTEMGFLPHWDW